MSFQNPGDGGAFAIRTPAPIPNTLTVVYLLRTYYNHLCATKSDSLPLEGGLSGSKQDFDSSLPPPMTPNAQSSEPTTVLSRIVNALREATPGPQSCSRVRLYAALRNHNHAAAIAPPPLLDLWSWGPPPVSSSFFLVSSSWGVSRSPGSPLLRASRPTPSVAIISLGEALWSFPIPVYRSSHTPNPRDDHAMSSSLLLQPLASCPRVWGQPAEAVYPGRRRRRRCRSRRKRRSMMRQLRCSPNASGVHGP